MGLIATGKEVVLVIPDYHAPFGHKDTLPFLKAVERKYSPSQIVCLGDEVDFHSISNYEPDPDGLSPGYELERAIECLQPIYKAFPKVKVCTSNHTARPYKKAHKFGLPKAFIKSYAEFLKAPLGWQWAEQWEIEGVIYEHGEGFSGQNGALKAALSNMAPTVIGHLHSWAGIAYSANPKHLIFGFNAGCLIDRDAYAFAYGKTIKQKPIVGCGVVNKGIPVFIPMILDTRGRWIGKL